MIVETASEIQDLGCDLIGYLGVVGVSPSTFGSWKSALAEGALVAQPERPPTAAEITLWTEIRMKMKDLAHRRHYTFGLTPLWSEYRGRITREKFRDLANEVRVEVNRNRRSHMLRYEFTHPDVAHSLDFVALPPGVQREVRRYMIRILDDCTRCTLRKAVTEHKGAGVGAAYVHGHLKDGPRPLVFKYDREFDVPQFEGLLLSFKVVPLPSPARYPQANGKNERANRDVQQWLGLFGDEQFWTTEELRQELDFCFEQLDELEERAILNGRTRRQAYNTMARASVDRDAFFRDATAMRSELLRRPDNKLSPTDAWWVATKETLKKYGMVRYSRPSEVSRDSGA